MFLTLLSAVRIWGLSKSERSKIIPVAATIAALITASEEYLAIVSALI